MKKAFYFDVETTGLSSYKHDIIQIACLIEINGETVEEFTSLVAPFAPENADDRALKIHGHSLEDMLTFPSPVDVYNKLIKVLGKHVNKFNKADKFIPIGYNVSFDISFLQQFFKKCGDKYYGSWFNWYYVDPRYRIHELLYEGTLDIPNVKLQTVCDHFGISIKAHDALSDIKATRELRNILACKQDPKVSWKSAIY